MFYPMFYRPKIFRFRCGQPYEKIGRSSKIRTYDPHVPNVVLYQAELCSERARL